MHFAGPLSRGGCAWRVARGGIRWRYRAHPLNGGVVYGMGKEEEHEERSRIAPKPGRAYMRSNRVPLAGEGAARWWAEGMRAQKIS